MHHLFAIPSLVDEICSYVNPSELAVLARVSSMWFQCAIKHLYKDVDLVEALSPLGKTVSNDGKMEFVDFPSDEDFKRFLTYRPYVRSLLIYPEDNSLALGAIRKSESKSNLGGLFPNVQSLVWHYMQNSPESLKIFSNVISSRINELSLVIYDSSILDAIFQLEKPRMLALRILRVLWFSRNELLETGMVTSPGLVKPFQEMLSLMTRLTTLHISTSLATREVVQCISRLPSLYNLSIGMATIEIYSDGIATCGDGESFPSLCSFSFTGDFESFYPIFPNPVATLVSLAVYHLETDNISTFIWFIVSAFPNMKRLYLRNEGEITRESNMSTWPVVPWVSIQPISRCKQLCALALDRVLVSVTLEELTEFLKSRETWLCFNILTATPLHLQDVLIFAQYCPNLEQFAINLDVSDEFRIEDLPDDLPTLENLESMHLAHGGGEMSSSNSLLLLEFLDHICDVDFLEISRIGIECDDDTSEISSESLTNIDTVDGEVIEGNDADVDN